MHHGWTSPMAGSLPIGGKSPRLLLSFDGRCLTRIKPEGDACLASSLGEGPLPMVLAFIACWQPYPGLLCLWNPHLPALERASWSSIYLNSLQAIRAPSHQLPWPLQQQIGAFLILKETAPTCHVWACFLIHVWKNNSESPFTRLMTGPLQCHKECMQ